MPQLIDFPRIVGETPGSVALALRSVCRAGEPTGWADAKARLHEARLWDRENPRPLLRFLGVRGPWNGTPPLWKQLVGAGEDEVFDLIAERLFEVNQPLFHLVLSLVGERPHMKDEFYKVLGSSAYKGVVPSRPALDDWLKLALDLKLLRSVGIAVTSAERAERFAERLRIFDIDEFLALDKPEPEPQLAGEAPAAAEAAATPAVETAPATSAPPSVPRWLAGAESLPNPRKRTPVVPTSRFARAELFSDEICEETQKRIAAWWQELARPSRAPKPEDFGFDAEAWVEGADELLYRIAVAAALVFRNDAEPGAFRALDKSGVLAELYQGTMPEELPPGTDARTLMLASLVARRCSESPGLAADLEQKKSAAEGFVTLEAALGRGLFKIELHWILGMLARLGVLRWDDMADYTALPHRLVRDQLFRMGFLASPYAVEAPALALAAKALRRAAGPVDAPEEVIGAFAVAAGCAYDCPNRKACEYPCRERLE